jgi:DNA-binding CsgD family transcriptional regulator
MVKESPGRNRKSSALRALTPREREILHWVAEGKRDSEIAAI